MSDVQFYFDVVVGVAVILLYHDKIKRKTINIKIDTVTLEPKSEKKE